MGFVVPDSGYRIPSVTWVDNNFPMARSLHEYVSMCESLSTALWDRYGWRWKPASLEILASNVDKPVDGELIIGTGAHNLKYCVVDEMIALGGKLAAVQPDHALLRHQLQKGESCFHTYRRHLAGKVSSASSYMPGGRGRVHLLYYCCRFCTGRKHCFWKWCAGNGTI